jgi:hypothetical protein
MGSSEFLSAMQSPVLGAVEVPKHALESYLMILAWVVIVPADNSDGRFNIGATGSHLVQLASDHQLGNGWIACFFVRHPLLNLNSHWQGTLPGLIQSELHQDCPNIAVLMDVDPM